MRDKPLELLEASPKATVPVLVLADGRVIDESLDIMRWALDRSDPEGWLKKDDSALIATNDGPFKQSLDRYKYPDRFGSESASEGRAQATEFLTAVDHRLAQYGCLHGTNRGLSDIALFPFVRQFAAVDAPWFESQPLPALHVWLTNLVQSDLFDIIMLRYPQWHADDAPTLFPA